MTEAASFQYTASAERINLMFWGFDHHSAALFKIQHILLDFRVLFEKSIQRFLFLGNNHKKRMWNPGGTVIWAIYLLKQIQANNTDYL